MITAAGVIFAASMFGMLFASISTLVQAGFIIGTGLLLDTFLVRTITVPAIAVLVGKANWWPSQPPPPHRAVEKSATCRHPIALGSAAAPRRLGRGTKIPAEVAPARPRQRCAPLVSWREQHDTLADTPGTRRCAAIDWRPYESVVRAPA